MPSPPHVKSLHCRIMSQENGPVLFLDAGDTLIFARRSLHEAVAELCRETGVPINEPLVRQTAVAVKQTMEPLTTLSLDTFRDWWMRMYAELLRCCGYRGSIRAAQEKLWGIWRSGQALRLFPDTVGALKDLRAHGYRLAVISNWDDTLEKALKRLDIHRYFEQVFCSYHLGVEKPDPRIFQNALRVMNVDPAATWHIGDSLESDVVGAKNAGIRPILIDYYERFDNREMDVPVVHALSEVERVIGGRQEGKLENSDDSE